MPIEPLKDLSRTKVDNVAEVSACNLFDIPAESHDDERTHKLEVQPKVVDSYFEIFEPQLRPEFDEWKGTLIEGDTVSLMRHESIQEVLSEGRGLRLAIKELVTGQIVRKCNILTNEQKQDDFVTVEIWLRLLEGSIADLGGKRVVANTSGS